MIGDGARSRFTRVATVLVFVLMAVGVADAQDDPPITELSDLVGSCGNASIKVTNPGQENSKAIVLYLPEDEAAGPISVECGALLQEGDACTFAGSQSPPGATGADVYSFTTKTLLEIGVDLGFDDVVADFICQSLFFGVIGDRSDYTQFKAAYQAGDDWMGVPLRLAYGAALDIESIPALCTSHLPLTLSRH